MFLGIEIGGTKLQLGLGRGDGVISSLWRGTVDSKEGSEGIRKQIVAAVPELLAKANVERGSLRGVGIGFGGPTDDQSQTVIKSHQIEGWDGFPLASWVSALVGVPAVLCNDADVAGLAEALFGAGKGLSPIFYVTIGTGVGGGLIIDGQIYRGVGRGAAEIGHLIVGYTDHHEELAHDTLENVVSGRGIATRAQRAIDANLDQISARRAGFSLGVDAPLYSSSLRQHPREEITAVRVAEAAREGDFLAEWVMRTCYTSLAEAINQLQVLLCPKRVVIGGGVSFSLNFDFLACCVADEAFPPFAGLTEIVPAALGEEVVVHGALALARQKLGGVVPIVPVPG